MASLLGRDGGWGWAWFLTPIAPFHYLEAGLAMIKTIPVLLVVALSFCGCAGSPIANERAARGTY
jgi:hypothetical protein